MGKMRFKLSHVMPHAWFYKLKEVGKPGRSLTCKASEPRKSAYASPINHKAVDIPFPADTPKRSFLVEPPFAEDFAAVDQLHLVELSDECRPSIVLPHSSTCRVAGDAMMTFSLDTDDPHLLSSAPNVKAGSVACAVSFDVRELEKRLNDLGSEDRRKYYASPMLLSVAVPSPMIGDDVQQSGGICTHKGGVDMQESSMDMCANGFLSNVCGLIDEERSDDLMLADDKGPLHATYGDPFCASINESNRHSTSSSDTGFERGSSSVWERDVFSITSDGSEAFTAAYVDDIELMHKSRQRFRRLRERMSPSLYATVHMDNGLSRFCETSQERGLVDNDIMRDRFKDAYASDNVQEEIDNSACVCNEVQDVESGRHPYVQIRNGESRNNHERPFSRPSPSRTMDLGGKHEGSLGRGARFLSECENMSDSLSMQFDRNDALSAQYDSGDDRRSDCTRKSSGEFSYARCKERLLSSWTSSVQSGGWIPGDREKEKLSNYTKFKLKQRNFAHSTSTALSGDIYLDPGLYNNVGGGKHPFPYDYLDSKDTESIPSTSTVPSRFEQQTDRAPLRRPPRTSSIYHIKSPHRGARGLAGQGRSRVSVQDQGPSWFKGTLRAVRESTQDPSFERFSPPSTGGGGGTPTRGERERSRVFDSFAMVKCSYDPKRDFKESMVEMIMEKDLCSSHDMVELLQCYLTLNADTYHDTIVKVFTEVWSEMFQNV